MSERERIARIVDPGCWKIEGKNNPIFKPEHEVRRRRALTVADAILPEIEAREAEIARLRELLKECAESLEAFVNAEYYLPDGTIHPARQNKYERDISPVWRARAGLDKAGR